MRSPASRINRTPQVAVAANRLLGRLVACLILAVSCHAAEDPSGPFADASLAPDDVTLYMHVRDAAGLRGALARRPIARLLAEALKGGELGDAWRTVAAAAGVDGGELFDVWLGSRCTLLLRPEGDRLDWILLTSVDPKAAGPVLGRLKPVRLVPRGDIAVGRLPDQDLRLARDGSTYLIGPESPGRLFAQTLDRLDEGGDVPGHLAKLAALERARGLGAGDAAVFVRHGPPAEGGWGGWSALVAEVRGDNVRIRQVANLENPPFGRGVTQLEWDASPLGAFEDEALIAVMEPTDLGEGPVARFGATTLGVPPFSREMRSNLGECRIICFGEEEGRLAAKPEDLLLPSAAIAVKVKDARIAIGQLDHHVDRVVGALNELTGDEAAPIVMPPEGMLEKGDPRRVDLGPVLGDFAANFPLLETASLNWTVASGPCGDYWVLATHRAQLDRTVAALRRTRERPGRVGKWASCGTMNGQRVGVHLRAYSDQAATLAQPGEGTVDEFRQTLLFLSELTAGLDRCRWRLRRPTREEMALEVELVLRDGESDEATD